MKFRITPSNDTFFVLFDKAAKNLAAAAHGLATVTDDFDRRDEHHATVRNLEHQGDEYTRNIFRELDSSFVTPFDREDIHALADKLDDVVDDIYHLSEILVLLPFDSVLPEFREQVGVLTRMGDKVVTLIENLSKMKGLRPLIDELDALESEGDAIYRRTLSRLFDGSLSALDVIKWKDLVDTAEIAIDAVEDVSDVVASILVKHA
jgi:uncharacterized protein